MIHWRITLTSAVTIGALATAAFTGAGALTALPARADAPPPLSAAITSISLAIYYPDSSFLHTASLRSADVSLSGESPGSNDQLSVTLYYNPGDNTVAGFAQEQVPADPSGSQRVTVPFPGGGLNVPATHDSFRIYATVSDQEYAPAELTPGRSFTSPPQPFTCNWENVALYGAWTCSPTV